MAKRLRPVEQAANISQKLADSMGYEHLETVFDKEAAGVYLRIHLDKEGGITLTDCETFHRAVQPLLEAIDYDYLEVCSAGIDRPIKTLRDANKAIGRQVEIRLFRPLEGRKEFTGILEAFDDAGFHVQTAQGLMLFAQKEVALARPTVDLSVLDETPAQNEEENHERREN